VTTADINTNCRLWRLRFDDIRKDPEKGGTIEILLTGSEGHRMLDNVTIDPFGRIVMDEDPGNNSRVSKIWLYQIATGEFIEVAHHNPKFFDPTILNNSSFITQDEESSGIVDASDSSVTVGSCSTFKRTRSTLATQSWSKEDSCLRCLPIPASAPAMTTRMTGSD
jgi:hypothetical protein